MSRKSYVFSTQLVLTLVAVVACSSVGTVHTENPKRIVRVNVVVENYDARVEALIIDRHGRRSGWARQGEIEEINGCISRAGWGDGLPDQGPGEPDSAAVAESERMQAEDSAFAVSNPNPLPDLIEFGVGNHLNYRAELADMFPGLLDQGGCELRLDPIHPGALNLAINAEGTGFRGCEDTTSVVVTPGEPQRWRLSWKVSGDSCVVKMVRLAATGPGDIKRR